MKKQLYQCGNRAVAITLAPHVRRAPAEETEGQIHAQSAGIRRTPPTSASERTATVMENAFIITCLRSAFRGFRRLIH